MKISVLLYCVHLPFQEILKSRIFFPISWTEYMIFIKIKTFKTNFHFIKKISFDIVLIESKALYNACVHTHCHLQYAINTRNVEKIYQYQQDTQWHILVTINNIQKFFWTSGKIYSVQFLEQNLYIFIKIKTFQINFHFIFIFNKNIFRHILIESKALYTHMYTRFCIYNMEWIQEMFNNYVNNKQDTRI